MKIYEVIDYTDEQYYTLGFFRTLEDAKQAIDEREQSGRPVSPWVDNYERIIIKEHKIGWGEGKEAHEVVRSKWWNGADKEYWKIEKETE